MPDLQMINELPLSSNMKDHGDDKCKSFDYCE
jgi:hypothetical protein